MAAKKLRVSADIEEGWGGVDFAEALRIGRIVPSEELAARVANLGKFLSGGAHRLAGMDGLGDRRGEALGLQGGEGGVEDGFGAAEFG
jgi:hypothetical protein